MKMIVSRRLRIAALGGLVGAGLAPISLALFSLLDGERPRLWWVLEAAIASLWVVTSLPGVLVENRGWFTMAFVCCFWGAIGAALASFWYARPRAAPPKAT